MLPLLRDAMDNSIMVDFLQFEVYTGLFLVFGDMGLTQVALHKVSHNVNKETLSSVNNAILVRFVIIVIIGAILSLKTILIGYAALAAVSYMFISPHLYHYIGGYWYIGSIPIIIKSLWLIYSLETLHFNFALFASFYFFVALFFFTKRVNFELTTLKVDKDTFNWKLSIADSLTWLYSSSGVLILSFFGFSDSEIVVFGLADKFSKAFKAAAKPVMAAFLPEIRSLNVYLVFVGIGSIALVYLMLEITFIQQLSSFILGENRTHIFRLLILIAILGILNVFIGFGVATARGNYSIKLRQSVLGVCTFFVLIPVFLLYRYIETFMFIIVVVELVLLLDYAKTNIASRRINA